MTILYIHSISCKYSTFQWSLVHWSSPQAPPIASPPASRPPSWRGPGRPRAVRGDVPSPSPHNAPWLEMDSFHVIICVPKFGHKGFASRRGSREKSGHRSLRRFKLDKHFLQLIFRLSKNSSLCNPSPEIYMEGHLSSVPNEMFFDSYW